MKIRNLLPLTAVVLVPLGVGLLAVPADAQRAVPDAVRGEQLASRFQCARCHDGAALVPAPRQKHCVHCHQAIRSGEFEVAVPTLKRWQKDVVHLLDVPSLDGAAGRLDPKWIAGYLLHPTDLRPALAATMPRFDLSTRDAQDLAAWLTKGRPPVRAVAPMTAKSPAGNAQRGRGLLETKGCGLCHRMQGVPPLASVAPAIEITPAALALGLKLAPDLALVRERMLPTAIVPWLLNPSAWKAKSAMPRIPLTSQEAADIATYLLSAELTPVAGKPMPNRLPTLEREVRFDEVNQRVLRKTCWHCHAEPAFASGDGGAGNTGGFGFKPRRLDLSSYGALFSGSRDDRGRRRSVFKKIESKRPLVGGLPRLVAHLVARQAEERGEVIEGVRGMPLGLPAVSPEDIQLVESWIVQGRKR